MQALTRYGRFNQVGVGRERGALPKKGFRSARPYGALPTFWRVADLLARCRPFGALPSFWRVAELLARCRMDRFQAGRGSARQVTETRVGRERLVQC